MRKQSASKTTVLDFLVVQSNTQNEIKNVAASRLLESVVVVFFYTFITGKGISSFKHELDKMGKVWR